MLASVVLRTRNKWLSKKRKEANISYGQGPSVFTKKKKVTGAEFFRNPEMIPVLFANKLYLLIFNSVASLR